MTADTAIMTLTCGLPFAWRGYPWLLVCLAKGFGPTDHPTSLNVAVQAATVKLIASRQLPVVLAEWIAVVDCMSSATGGPSSCTWRAAHRHEESSRQSKHSRFNYYKWSLIGLAETVRLLT